MMMMMMMMINMIAWRLEIGIDPRVWPVELRIRILTGHSLSTISDTGPELSRTGSSDHGSLFSTGSPDPSSPLDASSCASVNAGPTPGLKSCAYASSRRPPSKSASPTFSNRNLGCLVSQRETMALGFHQG